MNEQLEERLELNNSTPFDRFFKNKFHKKLFLLIENFDIGISFLELIFVVVYYNYEYILNVNLW